MQVRERTTDPLDIIDTGLQHHHGTLFAADLYSRQHPDKQWEKERDIIQVTINTLRYKCSIQLINDLENLQQLQKEDIRINKIIKTIKEGKENVHRFELYEGILYRKIAEERIIYIPKKTLRTLLWECHYAYGHTGADENHKVIREHFFHPRLAKLIRQKLSTCDS